MNPDDFRSSNSGRCVLTPGGYHAYIPNPLPPRIKLDWALVRILDEARGTLSELSGSARRLSNPHLLIFPYIKREAVLSSRIENTQAGMSDLLYFEADPSAPSKVDDVREVANYVKAMDYGLKRLKELPICGRLVREIHMQLMEGVRGERLMPGEFRKSQNWIGPLGCSLADAIYVAPPINEMNIAVTDWERYLDSVAQEPPLIKCALMHYQFEAIHPFLDGNGRIGRLLITFFLCGLDYLSQPLLYLSAFFERHRDEYYGRLLAVSQKGDWRGWIDFFLRGIAHQAREAIESAESILSLHEQYRNKLRVLKAPMITDRIIDRLFANPIVTVSGLSKILDSTFPTVQKGVDCLVATSILTEVTGQSRYRRYIAQELLKLLISSTDTVS